MIDSDSTFEFDTLGDAHGSERLYLNANESAE